MDYRLAAAIGNNVALYESVYRAHRLRFTRTGGLWLAQDPAPAWYSDAIAFIPHARVIPIISALEDRPRASVKDSFANLDLTSGGFRELFAATWMYQSPPERVGPCALTWRRVETPGRMVQYRELHGSANSLVDDLLTDPDVSLYLGTREEEIVAGALVNQSGPDVGISNVFVRDIDPMPVWADLVSLVAEIYPGRALVGYESGEDLKPAIAAGFRAIGPLRIWEK